MNDIDETKDLHRDKWKDYQREKKDYYKQKIVISEDTLWGWKKILRNSEWGHSLKRKTKDYQRKRVWWVRTSIEKKKDYYKQKIVVSEDTLLGWKKSLKMVSEDILWREKQKAIKEKGSCEWGHLWKEKKTTTNERLWWVRTHFWDEKNP